MRDRLIELGENLILSCKSSSCEDCEHNNIDYPHCMSVHFADYLLANGVIVPPCKVGDTVYVVFFRHHLIDECKVSGFIFGKNNDTLQFADGSIYTIWDKAYNEHFGKTVFLTREEAEQALKGGEGC